MDVLTGGAGDMNELGIFESFKVCPDSSLFCGIFWRLCHDC